MGHDGRLRLAVSGGKRGQRLLMGIGPLAERLEVTAACDPDPAARAAWGAMFPEARVVATFDELMAMGDFRGLLIAGPVQVHAAQAIAALDAGIHVLSEVPACVSHDEAVALLAAARRSKAVYMMAENCCFLREHMAVAAMLRAGVMGEVVYAEGGYLHDTRHLAFNADGSPTWRGVFHHREDHGGMTYPTHAFGPVAQWLGIGRDDAMATVYALSTTAAGMATYARRRFGDAHPGADPAHWARGDSAMCLIRTKRGRVAYIRMDRASARPAHNFTHELQGTLGCYRTQADRDAAPVVWLDGRSPGARVGAASEGRRQWEPIDRYYEAYDDPLWKRYGDAATAAGHRGADFFVIERFLAACAGEAASPIDVVDGVTWSSLIWLTGDSERRGAPVDAIDYAT